MKKINILIAAGFTLILIGMYLRLDQIKKDNIHKQETIESQAIELTKCKEANEHLWNKYYINVSEHESEDYE